MSVCGNSSGRFLRCSTCQQEKDASEFFARPERKRGFRYRCKACDKLITQQPENRRRACERSKRWSQRLKETDPEKYTLRNRKQNLYRTHKLRLEDYNRLLLKQNSVCAICQEPPIVGRGQRLHVDHNHSTGEIRGLLCHGCNVALGSFAENPFRLQAAIQYLNYHSSKAINT